MSVQFAFHDLKTFGSQNAQRTWRAWLRDIAHQEGHSIAYLTFVLGDNALLCDLHARYLGRTQPTDVLTFDYSETPKTLQGDIYISVHEVARNASHYSVPIWDELCRVMAHGILHLCGYDDKKPSARQHMHLLEEHYLGLRTRFQVQHISIDATLSALAK